MTSQPYVYRVVAVERVVDGDTYWLRVDVGFRLHALVEVRLFGWDTPEARKGSPRERAKAKEARQLASEFLATRRDLWVATQKDPDDFGRWLGRVWDETAGVVEDLGGVLQVAHLATPWPTRWRETYDQHPVKETPPWP